MWNVAPNVEMILRVSTERRTNEPLPQDYRDVFSMAERKARIG